MFYGLSIRRFLFPLTIHYSTFPVLLIILLLTWVATDSPEQLFRVFSILTIGLLALLLHEIGHALTAHSLHYPIFRITLTPLFGSTLLAKPAPHWDSLLITLAGPLSNLMLAAMTYFVSRLLPLDNAPWLVFFTHQMIQLNIAIALYNLLPLQPLDGSVILKSAITMLLRTKHLTSIFMIFFALSSIAFFLLAIILRDQILLSILLALPASLNALILLSDHADRQQYQSLKRQTVADYMQPFSGTTNPQNSLQTPTTQYRLAINAIEPALSALNLFRRYNIDTLLVYDEQQPVGIIILSDLMKPGQTQ